MAITVVFDAESMDRVAVCKNQKELKEYKGENFVHVTKETFAPSDTYPTWDSLIGKEPKEKKGASERAPRTFLPEDSDYEIVKPLMVCSENHPKFPIWEAIANNTSIAEAKAACPKENPKRATNGTYTFTSEFRYFLRTGHIVLK